MNPASTEASAVATAAQDPESSSSHQSEDLEQNTSMSMPQQEGRNEEQEEEEEEDVVELDKEDDDDDDEEHKAHNIIKVLKSQATQQHQQVVAVHHPHVMPVIPLMSAKPVTVQGSMTYGAHPIQHYHLHTTQYPYPYQQHQHHHHPYQYFHQHYVAPAPSTATATAHPHPSPQPMSALPPHPLHAPPLPPPPHHHHPPPPPSPQYYVYPSPMATHKDLIDNRELFFTTLSKFHLSLGTKLTVPKIGGKDLDLHALYKEVTDRGGLERVITERKWKEITVVLNFPRTTTSASFVLRKYYINLLHHYEQVHYFRIQGLPVAPPVHSPNLPVPITQSAPSDFKYPAALESPDKESRKRKMDSAQALGVDPASSIGSIVTGCIDAKLDYAYLVTVMVGTRKMRGVLYHVPPASGSRPQGASVSSLINMLEPQPQAQAPAQAQAQTAAAAASDSSRNAMVLDPCTRIGMGTRHRRRHMSRKDPNAPRQNRTGYNFFFAEQRAKLKSVHPDKDRAISKMIGDLWGRLSEDEKSPYQERGLEDRERYRREMREYKERLRMGGCVGGLGLHSSSSSSIRTSATAKKLDSFRNFGAAQQSSRPTPVQERKEQLLLQSRSDVPTMTRPCNSSHHCHSEFGKACDSMDSQDNPTSSDKNFVEGSQT